MELHAHSNSSDSFLPHVPSLDYEVAELTWENGQLAVHGLGVPRVANKTTALSSPTTWDKPRAGGTLESIVNQATCHPQTKSTVDGGGDNINRLVPWFDHHRTMVNPGATASVTMTMDALVPCNNSNSNIHRNNSQEKSTHVRDSAQGMDISSAAICSTRLGGTSGMVSLENTTSDHEYTKISAEGHDSISHSRSLRKPDNEEGGKKGTAKSSVSTKRIREAAIHNQSERKRRDKINQRMKTLQKLVPNSSKTDKASMLDEVIEYLKQLQTQVQMMSRMNIASMMLPLAIQQRLQMSMMGMGMGVMDMNTINRTAAVPPVMPPAAAFMPMPAALWDNPGECFPTPPAGSIMPDPLAALLACQSQPMTMDAYSKLAAMYQQLQQPPCSKN